MTDSSMIPYFLLGGTVNAIILVAIVFLLSRFTTYNRGIHLLPKAGRSRVSVLIWWLLPISSSSMDLD
jgi:hypothetical protein